MLANVLGCQALDRHPIKAYTVRLNRLTILKEIKKLFSFQANKQDFSALVLSKYVAWVFLPSAVSLVRCNKNLLKLVPISSEIKVDLNLEAT